MAVQAIARWSARNPYFATIVCGRVFDRARELMDASVSEYDVEAAVSSVIEESPRSFYQHFWSDSPRTKDEERGLEETKASLAVLALSRLQPDPMQYVERDLAARNTRGLSHSEAAEEIETLVDRGVVEVSHDDSHLIRFRVPMFTAWLKRHGGSEMRQERALVAHAGRIGPRQELGSDEVRAAIDGLQYQADPITTDDARVWCQQFGVVDDQRLMLRLLSGVRDLGLYGEGAFIGALKSIDDLVAREASTRGVPIVLDRRSRSENYFVTHVDETGKSGSSAVVAFRKHNRIYERHGGAPEKVLPLLGNRAGPNILVCIDDFIGTGQSAREGLRALIKSLDDAKKGWRDDTFLVFAAIAGFEDGIRDIEAEFSSDLTVVCPRPLSNSDRAFHEDSPLFESAEDRLRAREMALRYGSLLDRRQPLGYEESQALVVFHDWVPNNSLPILWKAGQVNDKAWIPLFPARL